MPSGDALGPSQTLPGTVDVATARVAVNDGDRHRGALFNKNSGIFCDFPANRRGGKAGAAKRNN
jgi:hypothetical protein